MMREPRDYLIWSIEHGMWWRPNRAGYTIRVAEAGRYTLAEATEIVDDANGEGRLCHECIIPVEAIAL